MIVITLMIRPLDSPPWLAFVRYRFRRIESVALENDQVLVWVPSGGSLRRICRVAQNPGRSALPPGREHLEHVWPVRSRPRNGLRMG